MKSNKAIIISIAAILILTAIIIGVLFIMNKSYDDNESVWGQKISDLGDHPAVGSLVDSFDENDNIKLSKLNAYNFVEFYFNNRARVVELAVSSQLFSLSSFNEVFPVQHIEILDETHICVIYKLQRDEKDYTYAYTFFERKIGKTEENVDYESWWKTGEIYFVNKLISSKAFDSVKVGDSAFDVNKIDNGVSFDADYDLRVDEFTSYRLLSDGIIIIDFKKDSTSENTGTHFISDSESGLKNFKVEKITFYPYDGETVPVFSLPPLEDVELLAFSYPELVKSGR